MLKQSDFKKGKNKPENGFMDMFFPKKPSIPDDICTLCPSCSKTIFNSDIDANLRLCPECGYHFRIGAVERINLVCDEGSFKAWDSGLYSCDPLDFPGYNVKLKKNRLGNNKEEVICGKAKINGEDCAIFAMEPEFMMGSMGSVVGEKITRLFEKATELKLPVVGFCVSGGARMQEGMLALMQMAKTSGAVKYHSDAGLLFISVLTDPTTGGVTASFAMEGDILLSEPGALIAFAGPRVIEQTIKQKLPKGFQRAEYLLEHGFLDAVVERTQMKRTLFFLLSLHKCTEQKSSISNETKTEDEA